MANKLVVVAWWLAALSIACSEGYPLLSGVDGDLDAASALECDADSDCGPVTSVDNSHDFGADQQVASCESLVGVTLVNSLDDDALWMAELGDDVVIGDAGLDLAIPVAKNMDEPYNWPARWGAWTRIVLQEPTGLRLEFDGDNTAARFMLLDSCQLYPVDENVLARGLGGIETGDLASGIYYLAAYADRAEELSAAAHFVTHESCDALPLLSIDDLSEPYDLTLRGQAGDFFAGENEGSHVADVAVSIELTDSAALFPATVELVIDSSGASFPYELALLSDCETETELVRDDDYVVSPTTTEFVPAGGMYAGEYFTRVVVTAEIETSGVYQLVIKSEDVGRYDWGHIALTGRVL